ncbi:MAG: CoA-binding protein [archaeon]
MIIAVVGASNNQEKYGSKVLRYLHGRGEHVIPINPHEKMIDGLQAYPCLSQAPLPELVVFVVLPSVTEQVLEEVQQLGIKNAWMQPGSESEKAIAFCKQHGISCTHHACIMLAQG